MTGNDVNTDDLEACHHLMVTENVFIKLKSRKLMKIKMKNKSKERTESTFFNNLYITESMYSDNCGLVYICKKQTEFLIGDLVGRLKIDEMDSILMNM